MKKTKRSDEEIKKKIAEQELKNAQQIAVRAGTPTYFFHEGESVGYGAWQETTITKVMDDNSTVYEIHAKSIKTDVIGNQKSEEKSLIVPWVYVRPLHKGESSFSCNEDIRLSYFNSSIESLISKHLNFGVGFDPDYQRGFVWTTEDQEKLLESVFMRADIGRFVFRCCNRDEWMANDVTYEIIDGKQRLITLLKFYENRIPYRGVYYNELSGKDRNVFLNASVSIAEVRNLSRKDVLRLFIMLNRGGKSVSDDIIQAAKNKLLEECE